MLSVEDFYCGDNIVDWPFWPNAWEHSASMGYTLILVRLEGIESVYVLKSLAWIDCYSGIGQDFKSISVKSTLLLYSRERGKYWIGYRRKLWKTRQNWIKKELRTPWHKYWVWKLFLSYYSSDWYILLLNVPLTIHLNYGILYPTIWASLDFSVCSFNYRRRIKRTRICGYIVEELKNYIHFSLSALPPEELSPIGVCRVYLQTSATPRLRNERSSQVYSIFDFSRAACRSWRWWWRYKQPS